MGPRPKLTQGNDPDWEILEESLDLGKLAGVGGTDEKFHRKVNGSW